MIKETKNIKQKQNKTNKLKIKKVRASNIFKKCNRSNILLLKYKSVLSKVPQGRVIIATCSMDRHFFVPSARPCQLSDSVIKALSVTGKLASGCRAGELLTSFEMLYCLHKAVNYNSQ